METTSAILRLVGGAATAPGFVEIKGTRYPMADPLAFSLREAGAFQAAQARVLELERKALGGKSTKADEVEYRTRLVALARVMVPTAPAAIWNEIKTGELGDLAVAFFGLTVMTNPRLQMAASMAAQSRRTGTTSSRSSRGSTRTLRSAAATG
jgi:hypothetical protein